MSSRTTRLIVALLFVLVIGAGIYLLMTSSDEVGNTPFLPEDPIEVRDDEVELPEGHPPVGADSLESLD